MSKVKVICCGVAPRSSSPARIAVSAKDRRQMPEGLSALEGFPAGDAFDAAGAGHPELRLDSGQKPAGMTSLKDRNGFVMPECLCRASIGSKQPLV